MVLIEFGDQASVNFAAPELSDELLEFRQVLSNGNFLRAYRLLKGVVLTVAKSAFDPEAWHTHL
jgi:hypothetical protein